MIPRMRTLTDRLLPDALWPRIQPLLPPPPSHARGGAPRTVADRACNGRRPSASGGAALRPLGRASTP
jgi:transposase